MCTLNMTFEVPDSKAIDIEALKSQLNDLFHVIVSRPSVLKKEVAKTVSWTEEFRGKWKDDYMTAEELVNEIRANRLSSKRNVVDL